MHTAVVGYERSWLLSGSSGGYLNLWILHIWGVKHGIGISASILDSNLERYAIKGLKICQLAPLLFIKRVLDLFCSVRGLHLWIMEHMKRPLAGSTSSYADCTIGL